MNIKRKQVGDGYEVTETYVYYSPRYNRYLTIPKGFYSNGANLVVDIESDSWIIHDHICRYAEWDCLVKIDNWTASTVLHDVLLSEGYRYLAVLWRWATYIFGGGAARSNGMFPKRFKLRRAKR